MEFCRIRGMRLSARPDAPVTMELLDGEVASTLDETQEFLQNTTSVRSISSFGPWSRFIRHRWARMSTRLNDTRQSARTWWFQSANPQRVLSLELSLVAFFLNQYFREYQFLRSWSHAVDVYFPKEERHKNDTASYRQFPVSCNWEGVLAKMCTTHLANYPGAKNVLEYR